MTPGIPSEDDLAEIDRHFKGELVKRVKAQHRACIRARKEPQESEAQFATRKLGREIKFLDDLTGEELNLLREYMTGRQHE